MRTSSLLVCFAFFWSFAEAQTLTYSKEEYSSLQLAIDHLESSGDGPHLLILPPGQYSDNILINKNIEIKGAKASSQTTWIQPTATHLVTGANSANVTLRNITFSPSATAISISGQGKIHNNIFVSSSEATAIELQSGGHLQLWHNSFHKGTHGILTQGNTQIINNIFNDMTQPIAGNTLLTTISHNLFSATWSENLLGSDNIIESPLYAASDNNDFHLLDISPAINAGQEVLSRDFDGTPPDLGAYGGKDRDLIPSPANNINASLSSDNISNFGGSVSWEPNLDPNIKGYFVFYSSDNVVGSYTGNISGIGTSPVTITNADEWTFSGIDLSKNITTFPIISGNSQQNDVIHLSWTPIEGIYDYILNYRIVGQGNTFQQIEVKGATTYTMSNLSVDQIIETNIQAYHKPTLSFSVVPFYHSDVSLGQYGDVELGKTSLTSSSANIGPISPTITLSLEPIVPYPLLPNNGGGCLLNGGQP